MEFIHQIIKISVLIKYNHRYKEFQIPFVSHWFLIHGISSTVIISSFGNVKNIYFSVENMIANEWFKMYINQEQFQYLKDSTYFELCPIESKIKIPTSKTLHNKYHI